MKIYTENDYQNAAERWHELAAIFKVQPSPQLEQRLERLRGIRYGIRRRVDADFDRICTGGPRFH